MSDRMTEVRNPHFEGSGHAQWGRYSRAEAIAAWRRYYEHQLDQATKLLAIADEELIVETYLGPYAMKNREEVTE